ncbi:MAG: Gfo/Idh/MocA family oxidoreductase [Planctomycetia bacterium]|nr:Gfo/Idh/MocA family oxidoreductase [Planctomycetia bacterium]
MKRRDFVKTCGTGLGLAMILENAASVYAAPANERLNMALIGCGDRSGMLTDDFLRREPNDVRFLYAVDPQQDRAERGAKRISRDGVNAQAIQDARRVFDDPEIHAVVLVTPDQWHALHTIQACQAGKDVYVEKPLSRTPFEGEQMIRAARKYKRVVQVGTQSRSAAYCESARQYIADGKLGDVDFCRVYNMLDRSGPASIEKGKTPPETLNWDIWTGPSVLHDYSPTYLFGWKWFWEYGTGQLGLSAVHQLDIARWILGLKTPKMVFSTGHQDRYTTGRNIPDTQATILDFGKTIVNVDQSLTKPYMLEVDWEVRNGDMFPYWTQNATHIEVYGTKGLMMIARLGAGWQVFVRTKNRQPVVKAQEYGRYTNVAHVNNFIDCIRSRNEPAGTVENGHLSTMLVHYANISYRLGSVKLEIDQATGKILNCPEAAPLWRPQFRKEYDIPEIG